MLIYIHICIYAYIHTCIHTYIHTYTHTYIHTYIHTHTHTYRHVIYSGTCAACIIHACMHTCMHACMHTCIHTYIHTCMQTYRCVFRPPPSPSPARARAQETGTQVFCRRGLLPGVGPAWACGTAPCSHGATSMTRTRESAGYLTSGVRAVFAQKPCRLGLHGAAQRSLHGRGVARLHFPECRNASGARGGRAPALCVV